MTEIRGYTAQGFEPVRDAFAANFEDDEELGAGFAVMLDGETVVDLQGGWADRKKTHVWDAETLVPVFSTTKGVAALVIGMLLDRSVGELTYDTAVASIWLEFAAQGKDKVTIGQMLSHQAGLPGFAEEIDPALWLNPPACAAAIAALPPLWAPGTAHGYHPLTWGYLVGELAKRIDGRTLGTILREDICAPAGIDFQIGLPEADHARCADIQRPRALAALGGIIDLTEG
ncbi:MAG: serine hydrolase domain-containing protein, partial [Pseudomonadota bacterium]